MTGKAIMSMLFLGFIFSAMPLQEAGAELSQDYFIKQEQKTGAVTAILRSAMIAPADEGMLLPLALIVGTSGIEVSGNILLHGDAAGTIGINANPNAGTPGQALTVTSGSAAAGSADQKGGDLFVSAGNGTGLGGGGNVRIQTAGANSVSGTMYNTSVDRRIIVAKAKSMTLNPAGLTSLMSITLSGTMTAGGRIHYTIRATDGVSQIATESGVIQYLATANSITCTVQTTDKLHLGTVNSGCTPGFFNPGSQPGIGVYDNVSFSSPASIMVHEVYYEIENTSGSPIRLEP